MATRCAVIGDSVGRCNVQKQFNDLIQFNFSFDLLGIQQTNNNCCGWMLFSLCCWCWYSCWCCGWIVPNWRQSMHQPEDECWCNQRKMQSNVRRRSEIYHLYNVFFFKNPHESVCPLSFIAGCLFLKRYLWTITRKLESFMLTDYVNTQIVYVKPLPLFSRWRNTLWVGLGGEERAWDTATRYSRPPSLLPPLLSIFLIFWIRTTFGVL